MTPGADLLDELRDLALAVAVEAGTLLVEGRPADLAVAATKSSATDIVTEMDRASERLLVRRILAARPDDAILGEEGSDTAGSSGVRWVIDPVDGTVNYLYGIPLWAVSVGVEVDGEVVVGVVEAPALGETYVAVRGRGAVRRDSHGEHPLAVNDPVALDRALVATGFGYTVGRRRGQARVVSEVIPAVRDIRRGGACSIDLCFLASGRVDAYYERGPMAWDLAAGGLVATEAGALLGGLHGAPAGQDLILAAGPALFGPLHDLLAAAGVADPDPDADVQDNGPDNRR